MLIILSFLQASLIPVDFILLALIARSFVSSDKSNYFLAFAFGILVSLLSGKLLGSPSIFYIFPVFLASLLRKSPFLTNPVLVFLSAAFLVILAHILKVLQGVSPNFILVAMEVAFILPVYFAVRFWEERFVPGKEIKLKMGR